MQAASPDAPVMTSRKCLSDHIELFSRQKIIVRRKALEVRILRSHRPVKDAKALVKTRRIVQQGQAVALFFSPGGSQEPAEQAGVSEESGIRQPRWGE